MVSLTAFEILKQRFPTVAKRLRGGETVKNSTPAKPDPLASLWAQSQLKNPQANTLYLISGFGDQIEALLAKVDPTSCVVAYEASIERLQTVLAQKDYAKLLADERFHLFAGECGVGEFERLHHLPVVRVTDVRPLRYSPAWSLAETAYASFFEEFAKQWGMVRRLHLTNFNDSLFWQATTLENIPNHCQAPDVAALKGLFSDVPVILVGAGPSLDEATEFLKSAADRALIIGVNSSYRKLRRIGIKPHMVLAADPRGDTARGFQGQVTDDGTYLVAPFIVNPEVVKAFGGHAFSWSGDNNFLISVLRQRLGLPIGTGILEKGTVSISVADLAYWMGSRKLILVGQDMAITSDGVTHTSESIYGDNKHARIDVAGTGEGLKANHRFVEGNTQKEVPTLENLFIYLKSFEQWVEAHPAMQVVNTARLGAKINGAPYKTYTEAATLLPDVKADFYGRLEAAFKKAPERKIEIEAWREALRPSFNYAQKIYTQALSAAVMIENLPERFWQQAYKEQREVKEIGALATSINSLLDKSPDDYRILIEASLKKRLFEFQQSRQQLEAPNPYALELTQNREFFWALVEGIEPTLGLFNRFLVGKSSVEGYGECGPKGLKR